MKYDIKYTLWQPVFVYSCGKFHRWNISMIFIDEKTAVYNVRYWDFTSSFCENDIFTTKEELVAHTRNKFEKEIKIFSKNL